MLRPDTLLLASALQVGNTWAVKILFGGMVRNVDSFGFSLSVVAYGV